MNLHYSQTSCVHCRPHSLFNYLMNLHYSQTLPFHNSAGPWFNYLMNLHYSQTTARHCSGWSWFNYLMNLHYSQTLHSMGTEVRLCLTTLWIYTILKRTSQTVSLEKGLTTLWIYTILKRGLDYTKQRLLFNYLMNLHYSQTAAQIAFCVSLFNYLMNLHYSQTSNKLRPLYSAGQIHKI